MKIVGYILFSMLLNMAFCAKEEVAFKSKGIITGRDYRKCACRGERCGCCGDWVVQIDSTAHIFKDLPKDTKIDLWKLEKTNGFPIQVSLDWKVDPDACAESWGYIVIERIRLD